MVSYRSETLSRFALISIITLGLFVDDSNAVNPNLSNHCLHHVCNAPEKSLGCTEISSSRNLDFKDLSPEDLCCPIYECQKHGLQYLATFGGHNKLSYRIRRALRVSTVQIKTESVVSSQTSTVRKVKVGQPKIAATISICEGVKCDPKPELGTCASRSAMSMEATAVYGPTRVCCPLWACTHPNGTVSMHYSGPKDQKVRPKSRSMSPKNKVDPEAGLKDTCSGVYCMEGKPSKNCRSSSPAAMKTLMKIQEDCCPMWTCTNPRSAALFYIHPGLQQKSKFWRIEDLAGDDKLSSAPVTEPPPEAGNGTTTLAPPEPNDLEVDIERGVKLMSLKKVPSPKCPRVECMPPQEGLKCSALENPGTEKLKLLGLDSDCCPIYKCTGTKKAFVLQFGMYAAEPKSNSTSTENPLDAAASMRPTTPPVPVTTTTAPVTTVESTKTTTTTEPSSKTTKSPGSKTTSAPESEVKTSPAPGSETKTTASPEVDAKTTPVTPSKAKTTDPPPKKTKTTVPPATKTKTTTVRPKKGKVGPQASTKKPGSTSTKLQSTTPAPAAKTKTTIAPPKKVKGQTSTKKPGARSMKLQSTAHTPTDEVSTTPTPTEQVTSESGSQLSTTALPEGTDDPEVVDGEEIDDPSMMITNSTVDKPQCKNMQCFPAPSKDTCVVAPLTDCDLVALLGSAVDCCPSYKCKTSKGYVIQFGMTDGISESVISSPVSEDEEPVGPCNPTEISLQSTTKNPEKESHFEIDAVNSELGPVTVRPVMIFDMINHEVAPSNTIKEVRYVKSCADVSCSPPPDLDIKYCQKLPKGTVPKQMKPFGITGACCFVWKCVHTDSRVSTHYGMSDKPVPHIPFEFNGKNTDKLPKVLKVKDSEPPASAKSKCPNVICAPPLPNADCKVADPSAIKMIKGSLRQKKKCCPIWTCKRKDGTSVTLYGRTCPSGYKKGQFRSILQGKAYVPPTQEETTEVLGIENELDESKPKKSTSKSKPQLKSSVRILHHPTTVRPSASAESQAEKTPSKKPTKKPTTKGRSAVKLTTKKPTPASKPKPKASPAKKQPTQQDRMNEMQRQQMAMQQNQLAMMQQQNMENMNRMQQQNNQAMMAQMNLGNPGVIPEAVDVDGNTGDFEGAGDGEIPEGEVNSNVMVQRMDINGMVMETRMPSNGGPPMPEQSMQLPGITMNQYG